MKRRGIIISQEREEDEVLEEIIEKMVEDIPEKTRQIANEANEERKKRMRLLYQNENYIETISDEELLREFFTN